MGNRKHRLELSAIYLVALLLVVAVGALVNNVRLTGEWDPFPNLYATAVEEFVPPEAKTVYLTFDDGPSRNTEEILAVLRKHGIQGTFFVTAQNADEPYAAQLLEQIRDEGHTIGLHSYSHRFDKIYHTPDAYLEDLDKLNEYLADTVGVRPSILRFPGGSASRNASKETMSAMKAEVTRRGYLYYDWDVVSGDDTATVYPAEYLAERIVNGASGKEQAIVLMHDNATPTTTAQAVDMAVERLRELGYTFRPLTERVRPGWMDTP